MTPREFNNLVEEYTFKLTIAMNTGKIHVNKDGYIKKSFKYKTDNRTGERLRIQGEGKTIEECAKSLARDVKRKSEKTEEVIKGITFGEVAKAWYERDVKYANISDGNKENYYGDLYNHIIPALGHFDISYLDHDALQDFLNTFYGKGESMVKKIKNTTIRVMKYAMTKHYIPHEKISLVMPKVVPIKKKVKFEEHIIKLLVKAQKEYPQAYVFLLLLATGIRPCEAYKIRYADIDFNKKRMNIEDSKTENGIRIVPIPDFAFNLILADKKRHEKRGFKMEYVFHQDINPTKPHTPYSLRRTWQTTCRNMEIANGAKLYRNQIVEYTLPELNKLKVHNLRHTYCTMLMDCFVDSYFIKRLMGHSLKGSITHEVYTLSGDDVVMEAAKPFLEKIDRICNET